MTTNYEKGKLYKVGSYLWPTFNLYTKEGSRLTDGRSFRKFLLSGACKDAIFIYLGYIPAQGNTIALHHVVYQDMVGTVDARMILEPLKENNNHEE